MIHTFTIHFLYRSQTYQALAVVIKRGNDLNVSVQFTNSRLDDLVPEGEIFIPLHASLQRASRPTQKQQLIQCVREAVIRHLSVANQPL